MTDHAYLAVIASCSETKDNELPHAAPVILLPAENADVHVSEHVAHILHDSSARIAGITQANDGHEIMHLCGTIEKVC